MTNNLVSRFFALEFLSLVTFEGPDVEDESLVFNIFVRSALLPIRAGGDGRNKKSKPERIVSTIARYID